jgi:TonB family protein
VELAHSNRIRAAIGSLVVLLLCPHLHAQEPQIDALADQMAVSLSHAKLKTVMVFDFVGPDETNALRQKLAADFRTALVKTAYDFQVEDRSKLLEILRNNRLAPDGIPDAETASWIIQKAGVDAFIFGTLSNGIGSPKLTVEAFPVSDSHRISKFETSITLTEDLKALIAKGGAGEFVSLPVAGKNGYSVAKCISCPPARFSEEAKQAEFDGTVLLEITVTEEGRATDIFVKNPIGFGLTRQAIRAVQEWRFSPADGPDGKPAAVRVTVHVTFHLY